MGFRARGPRVWPAAAALVFLIVLPLALFFPALFQGKLIYGHDLYLGHLPFHDEVERCLAAGQWPLWMPNLLGGMPGIAACDLFFIYPTDLFSCLRGLPMPLMLGIDAYAHVALAGVGMFLFLRRLNRSVSASLLGAAFFALSGSQISQLYGAFYNFVEGIAWVPWAFWASHKACKEKSWAIWGLCGAAFALQILAGAAQLFTYTFVAVSVFALGGAWNPGQGNPAGLDAVAVRRARLSRALGLGLALALAGLLSAPQLWPTLQYMPLTARQGFSYSYFTTGSIRFSDALTWLVPGFFGWQAPTYHGGVQNSFTCEYFGLLPWALAASALAALWKREALVRWMAALALATLLLAQCRWRVFYDLVQSLPVISGFRIWSRALFLLTFAACVLAAFGWDALRSSGERRTAFRGACVFLAVALGAALFAWSRADACAVADASVMPWLAESAGSVQAAAGILGSLAKSSALTALELLPFLFALLFLVAGRVGGAAALALALAFHCVDQRPLLARFVRFTDIAGITEAPRFTALPPAPPGVEPWRVFDPDSANPNSVLLLGYENLYGDESVPMKSYVAMLAPLQKEPGRFAAFMDLMNVRYLFRHSRSRSSEAGDTVSVLVNPHAFPRAWLVGRSRTVSGDDSALRLLGDPSFHPRDEVALEEDPGLKGTPPKGGVFWLDRSPEAFSLRVNTDEPSALVVSNFWYPSWKAAVDGKEAPVLKADGGLQAILVREGTHQIKFWFDAGLLYDAFAACLAGLVFLAGLLWRERRLKPGA